MTAMLYVGIPDRLILTANGKCKFVELKQPGKKLRPEQEYWKEKLVGMGFEYEMIDSYEKVKEQEKFLM